MAVASATAKGLVVKIAGSLFRIRVRIGLILAHITFGLEMWSSDR